MLKTCTKCGIPKTMNDFPKEPRNKDGRSSHCRACCREKNKEWRKRNSEYNLQRMRKWREDNSEYIRQKDRERYAKNSEQIKEKHRQYNKQHPDKRYKTVRAWQDKHPEKIIEYARQRRVRKLGADGNHTIQEWNDKKDEYGNKCAYCGCSEILTEDHIIPLIRGGSDYIENIVPACISCNSSKNDMLLEEWLQRKTK